MFEGTDHYAFIRKIKIKGRCKYSRRNFKWKVKQVLDVSEFRDRERG